MDIFNYCWAFSFIFRTYTIPASSRQRPSTTHKLKEFNYSQELLPSDVIHVLREAVPLYDYEIIHGEKRNRTRIPNTAAPKNRITDKYLKKRFFEVLEALGGVRSVKDTGARKIERDGYVFDYDILAILPEVVHLGAIPEKYSHLLCGRNC